MTRESETSEGQTMVFQKPAADVFQIVARMRSPSILKIFCCVLCGLSCVLMFCFGAFPRVGPVAAADWLGGTVAALEPEAATRCRANRPALAASGTPQHGSQSAPSCTYLLPSFLPVVVVP
jgi:hypothetical protein